MNEQEEPVIASKRKMIRRRFNAYESTDSELDYEDDVFSDKLVALIQRDFSRLNLQLLKGIIMKPAVKQHVKESDHFLDNPEEIPVALEEIMLRKKIHLEQELEKERKRAERKERMLELQAQVMVNGMVPDKATISVQTEDPTLRH